MQFRPIRAAFGFIPLLALVLAAPASAQETQDTTVLPEALRAARGELNAAFAKLDPTAAAAVFAADGAIDFQGQTIAGRQGVGGWFGEVFTGMSGLRSGTATFVVTDDSVTERSSYVVVLPEGEQGGNTETTWKKQEDGSWKIARMVIM